MSGIIEIFSQKSEKPVSSHDDELIGARTVLWERNKIHGRAQFPHI